MILVITVIAGINSVITSIIFYVIIVVIIIVIITNITSIILIIRVYLDGWLHYCNYRYLITLLIKNEWRVKVPAKGIAICHLLLLQ